MESSVDNPTVLIVSSSSTKPKSLIKLITGGDKFLEEEPHTITHAWEINTKYYTAQVNICGITDQFVRTDEFNNKVEALIVHMDTNKVSGLLDIEKWINIENDCDPDVKILLTNYCTTDTKVTKLKAIEWCLKHGYELIELYPTINLPAEEDTLMKEKFGVDRIIEALQTHVWSNLIMKEKPQVMNNAKNNEGDFEKQGTTDIDETNNVDLDCSILNDVLTNDAVTDFTELFSQLHMIKESMKSMPLNQRKQCAEQMVTAFWHAIGGDEEEIADI